jgi:hypothetical protein
MNHGDHKEHRELLHAELSAQVIAFAIEVHLLSSVFSVVSVVNNKVSP